VTWPEAEILADPVKRPAQPTVLVRRRQPLLLGPSGEELIHLEGLTHISLFTGAGGFDLGMEAAGFITLCQHEWDESACATLLANRPRAFRHSALIQGNIKETPTGMILKAANLRTGEPHIVTGGPPCQGFSRAGRRRLDDLRNTLVYDFLRVVNEAKPKFFIMENVPGFVSFNQNKFMEAFLKAAYDCFYELVYGIVNAVEYHVPQDRCRFICMGTRRDLYECDGVLGSLPKPECFGRRDLHLLHATEGLSAFAGERELLTHAPGIRYFPDRPVLVPPAPTHGVFNEGRSGAFISFYRKLRAEEPDRIVTGPKHQED